MVWLRRPAASGYLYLTRRRKTPAGPDRQAPSRASASNLGQEDAVLRFISMGDIQVAHGSSFKAAAPARVPRQSDLGPILVEGGAGGVPFVALGSIRATATSCCALVAAVR